MLKESYKLFSDAQEEASNWFSAEIASIRTGRVTPDLVTSIQVDVYGSSTPLSGLASVNNSDARTLVVSPWDPGSAGAIVEALTKAELGATPGVDGEVIRLAFPSLTEELRAQAVKMLHKKAEEARVRLRQARDESIRVVKDAKDKDQLTEDDFYEGKKKLDEMIAEANSNIEEIAKNKEKEIRMV